MKQKVRRHHQKLTVECLACGDGVYVGLNPKIGSYVICNGCDSEFQVVDLEPVLIDWPGFDDYSDEDEGYYDDIYDEYDH